MKIKNNRLIFVLGFAPLLLLAGCLSGPARGTDYWQENTSVTSQKKADTTVYSTEISGLLEYEKNNLEVYNSAIKSVVNITTRAEGTGFLFHLFPQSGTASGCIIDDRGYIATNYHVVKGAEFISVTLYDGSVVTAKLTGIDPENDLAVIKIDPNGLDFTVLPFAESAGVFPGQKVIALGNPFGLEMTLTAGVVSGKKRSLRTEEGFILKNLIQTDAAINPGNSGGALLNAKDELIGINTMIFSPTGGSVGIGFAVPSDTIRRVSSELIEYGRVQRGWIDIVPIQLTRTLIQKAKMPVVRGILISEVTPGSAAEKAGLRGGQRKDYLQFGFTRVYLGGDIIVSMNGIPVTTIIDYLNALETTAPGDVLKLEILRNYKTMQVEITLSERPKEFPW